MTHRPQSVHRRPAGDPESGIVLLMVVFLTFLMLLSLAIAAPKWAHELKRQRDIETIHRGQQYLRAIQLYYRKFHRYPTTMKELEHTNDIRFLRQRYKDPLTGKDDWKLVLYGHAHVHPLGVFGKPLSDLGAMRASGGMYAVSGKSGSSTSSTSSSNNSGFGFGSGSSPMGSPGSSSLGLSGSSSIFGKSSSPISPVGGAKNSPAKNSAGSGSLGSDSSGSGLKTNTPFVGVVPPVHGHSIVDYRDQDNYDRWEFNYDPIVDQLRSKVSILGGSQSAAASTGSSLNGSHKSKKSSGNGIFGNGNGIFGKSNGIFGNSGSSSGSGGNSGGNSGNSGSSSGSSGSANSNSGSSQ